LKEAQDDVAIETGADRGRRWTDNRVPAPRGRQGVIDDVAAPEIWAGNAANAALAAATVAKRVSTFVTSDLSCCVLIVSFISQAAARRKRIFITACVPSLTELDEARTKGAFPGLGLAYHCPSSYHH